MAARGNCETGVFSKDTYNSFSLEINRSMYTILWLRFGLNDHSTEVQNKAKTYKSFKNQINEFG